MANRSSGLGEILVRAHQPQPPVDRASFGPRRGICQCHHGLGQRYPVAEVWGHHLIGTESPWNRDPVDLRHPGRETWMGCRRCRKIRLVDCALVRAALRRGEHKINIDEVATDTVRAVSWP